MKNIAYGLFVFLFFPSCISISENGYRALTKTQRNHLKQFSIDSIPITYSDGQSIIELTGGDVKKIFAKEQFTWIYFWIPYCKSQYCRPMSYYEKIGNQFSSNDLHFIMLSQVYDSSLIAKQVNLSGFNSAVYVIKDAQYGHNMQRSRDKFTSELVQDRAISKQWPAHMIFKGDSLVYYGIDISAKIMDSVIKKNDTKKS